MALFRLGADENYDKICGQVLLTTNGRLAFYCTTCGKYRNYQSFLAHLLEECFQFMDDDIKDWVTKESLTATYPIRYKSNNNFVTEKSRDVDTFTDPLAQKPPIKIEFQHVDEYADELMPTEDWNQDTNEIAELEETEDVYENSNKRVKSELEKQTLRCHICQLANFKTANHLRNHLKRHTKDAKKNGLSDEVQQQSRPQSNQLEKYCCEEYGEGFENHCDYVNHQKEHNKQKDKPATEKQENESQTKSHDTKTDDDDDTFEGITFDDMLDLDAFEENIDENSNDSSKAKCSKDEEIVIGLENVQGVKENKQISEEGVKTNDQQESNQMEEQQPSDNTSDAADLNSAKCTNQAKKKIVVKEIPVAVRKVRIRQYHLPKSNDEVERKYKCPLCTATFTLSTSLKYHLKRHTGNRPYSCPDCDKKFFTSSEVRLHSRVHKKLALNFLCTECGLSFENNYKLLSHQKRHKNQRDYVCDLCQKAFFEFCVLKAHKRSVHDGEKKYSCEICAATFKRRHGLTSHMKQHENKREFKCNICEAAYNVKSALYAHMKSKHESVPNAQCLEKTE